MSDDFTVKPFDLARTLERDLAAARAESEEQARLLGMSAERECALRGGVERLERENAALREKVDDWENAALHALDHRPDEQHCTCVAPLIGKVKQLQRELAVMREDEAEAERRVERLTIALRDAISTYDPNRKEMLVTAERQEAWQAALKEATK